MRILYHHRTQGKGGEGVHIREVVKALRALGHEVEVLSPPGVDIFAEENPACAAKGSAAARCIKWFCRHVPQLFFECMEIGYNLSVRPRALRLLRATRFDLVYERYAFFSYAVSALASREGIPLILEMNEVSGIKRQRGQVLVGLADAIEKKICSRACAIFAVSSYLKAELVRKGVAEGKISVVPNAINPGQFAIGSNGQAVREKFGFGADKVVFTFIGHFSRWDRLDDLVRIFAEVCARRPQARLMIVGDGFGRTHLDALIAEHGLSEAVRITGVVPRPQVPEYVAAADVCIIPHSNPFGSPLVLFEYMAMAKAVIAPRVAPVCDVVEDGVQARLFDLGDRDSLKDAILALCDDPSARSALGTAARDKVVSAHTWEHNARKIVETVSSLRECNDAGRRPSL